MIDFFVLLFPILGLTFSGFRKLVFGKISLDRVGILSEEIDRLTYSRAGAGSFDAYQKYEPSAKGLYSDATHLDEAAAIYLGLDPRKVMLDWVDEKFTAQQRILFLDAAETVWRAVLAGRIDLSSGSKSATPQPLDPDGEEVYISVGSLLAYCGSYDQDDAKPLAAKERGNLLTLLDGRGDARIDKDETRREPDWAYWTNMGFLRVDDAIFLSCNIDPGWHGRRTDIHEVRVRKSIVESHLASGSLSVKAPRDGSDYSGDQLVDPSEFRRWGESLPRPLDFPSGFPSARYTALDGCNLAGDSGREQLDARERTTLLTIIGALAEQASLDLSKPHKAGEAVAALLEAKGVRLSGRTVGEHLKGVQAAIESRKS